MNNTMANISRFLDLQSQEDSGMIMLSHQEKAAAAKNNIARFLDLQSKEDSGMIMLSHQMMK
ncbi:hypothetical protein [Archangium violaceum]|uniref:hypothetical protein n=1 Tax=Archangium violaceum TaxID=83451 RepID=UPI0036DBE1BC